MDRSGWSFEARLGVIMVAALFLGTKGGISRGSSSPACRACAVWNRIAIVIAFASVVVLARLLDRLRVVIHRRHWVRPQLAFASLLVVVLLVGVLDQASPAEMPDSKANAKQWHADAAFVASIERQLPKKAMVFQLPVADFPEHSAIERLSGNDMIKEGYLHSKSLRWSAGGVRGRDGEWQFPASLLSMRDLARGVLAMDSPGSRSIATASPTTATTRCARLEQVLGRPIAENGDRLLAWDLRPAASTLLGDMSAAARRSLAEEMLDAPLLYLSTDVDSITSRGDIHAVCAEGVFTLVNPGKHTQHERLDIRFKQRNSLAESGALTIDGRRVPITVDNDIRRVPVDVPPGTTKINISVDTPDVRCQSTPLNTLPSISAHLVPVHAP